MIKNTITGFVLTLTLGCGSSSDFAQFNDSPNDTGDDDNGTEMDTDTLPADSSPEYWSIAGTWTQVDGQLQTDSVALDLYFWTESLDLLCTFTIGAAFASNQYESRPDTELYSWWNIGIKYPADNGDCPWRIPESDQEQMSVQLGFGPYDSRLDGAMTASGYDPSASSPFGLFIVQPSNSQVLTVFGIAGTEEQYYQESQMSEEGPVADGTYLLTALYLLPYE